METSGRIATTPDTLEFTVENVEKVGVFFGVFLSAHYALDQIRIIIIVIVTRKRVCVCVCVGVMRFLRIET